MTTQSNLHDWAKNKLDEMDASVTTLQGKASQLQGEARTKAESALADMHTQRSAFQETLKKEGKAGQAELTQAKVTLDTHVSAFEASAKQALSHTGGTQ